MSVDYKNILKPKALHYKGFPTVELQNLSNGAELYIQNMGNDHVLRIELLFEAGRYYETKKLTAELTAKMLLEGTRKKTAEQLNEAIEYYGATLKSNGNYDTATLLLYCTEKHVESLLQIIVEIVNEPLFNDSKLAKLIARRKQSLQINLEDVDYVASQKSFELMFGSDHPYGYFVQPTQYDSVTINDIKQHFSLYKNGFTGLVSGAFSSATKKKIVAQLSQIDCIRNITKKENTNVMFQTKPRVNIEQDNEQAAIRIAKPFLPKHHPDFAHLSLLNTIFGGYFGSRLMKNIREAKGYTYGVYSMLGSFYHQGYWYVATQVNKQFVDQTIDEIKKEMERLHNEKIKPKELMMAKNYCVGAMMAECDGAFKCADVMREMVTQQLPFSWYNDFALKIENCTAGELQDLAKKHLVFDQFQQLVIR